MKEITLKEWSAMLPTWVMCEVTDMGEKKISKLCGLYDCGELVFHNIVESHQGFEMVKPILRDLDLTKEIEHNGEKFVPIDNLTFNSTIEEFKGLEKYSKNLLGFIKYADVQLLLEWHFNIFDLPDELIVKVTEDFNPYK